VKLHFVTGKGGTGKSTIAAALALALAAGGRKVLLVEVEGRQGIAQLFDVPPLPYNEVKIATADGGGQVNALAIDTEAAFLEYLDMFYNLGLAGRAMRRIGAVEFATTIAPGLRDVLLTGKIREIVTRAEKGKQPVYDAVVVDSPPTGRIARFLDVTKAVSDLAKGGPVHSQAESVVKVLRSDITAIHLVTLLEALPMQETLEAIDELKGIGLPIGSVIVNRNIPAYLSPDDLAKAAEGEVDAVAIRADLDSMEIELSDNDFAGLLTETIQHATRIKARSETAEELVRIETPRLELPTLPDGVDLGSLYELAEVLAHQGVR
jgi:anion-transporting  ArsA/GET3 family ATPase